MHTPDKKNVFLAIMLTMMLLVSSLLVSYPPVAIAAGPELAIDTATVQPGQDADVPIGFTANGSGISALAFWIDYDESCLSFDPTDSNGDDIPDNINLNVPAAFNASVSVDASNTDSELRFVIADFVYPLGSMPDGDLLSITFGTTCTPATGSSTTAPVKFSTAQAPSFGNTSGLDVAGTATDGAVTIESPGPTVGPELNIGTDTVSAGQDAVIPVTYTANGNDISSMAFWIDYDESCLSFDPTDSNGDDIPDNINLNVPAAFNASVSVDASNTDSELRFVIADFVYPLGSMPDGDLLSITFGTTCTPATGSSTTAPVKFSTAQAPSFGNTSGLDVAGTATDGAVTIESPGPSTGPEVRIGTDTVSAGQDAVIPVTYTANGNAIIRTEFWIDYDESCLSFDPTDSDGNSVPDDVSFNLPITFNGTVNFDESSTGSELHVIVSKATTPYPGPSQELPNGNLLSITFGTTCTPATGSSTTAPVKFSMSPTPSFTNTSGNNVTGTTIDGTVTINGPASLANLVLPHETGDQGTTVDIPMSVSNIDGLLGALITVSFDSTVLQAQEASVGSLASACSIADNTSTAGQITLSLACASALSGDGTLALLTFNVVGSPGSSTPLSFSSVSLNDGAMSASTTNGSFQINEVYSITGQVEYWNAGTAVEGTLLALSGNQTESTQSNQAGAYSFTLAPGNYTVTPEKTDDIDGISAYDASLVLQHTVHSITLTGYAAQAADVNKTNTITPMDAVYILQKSVDLITLPFPGASVIWEFDPAERSYLPLSSDHTNQDFTAILLGDVSGNWNGSALMDQPDTSTPSSGSALLVLEQGPNDAQRTTTATVTTTVKWQTEDRELYGLDLVVGYDSSQVTGIELESLASNVSFDYNISEPGTVRIGVASEQPIVGDTDLIAIQFQQAEGNDLNLNGSAQVNEQPAAVDVTIIPAPSDGRVYLPFIRQ